MQSETKSVAEKLQYALETINGPEGRDRLDAYLKSRPFPRFWAHPDSERKYIHEEADGTRTPGHFDGGVWVPEAVE